MSDKLDYKKTLLLPETTFEMKANLVAKEKYYQAHWAAKEIYQRSLTLNKKNKPFILHDGPPYANGSLHVGHAINKILKDIIVRFKTQQGYFAPFVPGWDTHGLPIENKMLQEMKASKDSMDKVTLRKLAREYALSQVEAQKKQFAAMNLFTDFKEIYLTLSPEYEARQLEVFKKMYFDGLVYKGLRPVFWSPSSQSALAEAEVEYETVTSPQILVAFKDASDSQISYVIMTTTPWTLIANAAISVNADFDYDYVKVNNHTYVIASQLLKGVSALCKWEKFTIIKTVPGRKLVGHKYVHPLNGKVFPVVDGPHVNLEIGTGLVHTAPLFGEDDFLMGKKHHLEMIMHVNDDGTFNDEAKEYAKLFYLDANKAIGEALKAKGALLSLTFIKHQYPHDWRTHKPVIFRGTPQWFVSIDKIQSQIIEQLKSVRSYPEWGVDRLQKMIESRSDWTISRQRTWGVPIIIFYDKDGKVVHDQAVFDHVISLVAKHGTDIWFSAPTDELLPPTHRRRGYTKEESIVDVWFDSGSSSVAVRPSNLQAPFDLYVEGSDQYRGWFNSSLINSVAYRGVAPFKQLVSHGFVLDGHLEKMSKSKGNVVDPFQIINKEGADILRLWVANAEYTSDVTISEAIISQTVEMYRNIRTKLRFLLGNLSGFDTTQLQTKLKGYDAVVAEKLFNLQLSVLTHFNDYKFFHGVKEINHFISEISAFYLDYTKDTLYADKRSDPKRLAVLTNIFNIAQTIIMLLAPVLVTTMEEAYEHLPLAKRLDSVHLERFNFKNAHNIVIRQEEWKTFELLRSAVNGEIEKAKQAGKVRRSQEVHFNVTREWFINLCKEAKLTPRWSLFRENLDELLMVGKLSLQKANSTALENWGVLPWVSDKCERCWKHFDAGTLSAQHLCSRCHEVILSNN